MKKNIILILSLGFIFGISILSLSHKAFSSTITSTSISPKYSKNYSIYKFDLFAGVDPSTQKQVMASTIYVSITATSTDVPFYKNGIIIKGTSGSVGNTSIAGISANLIDKGTYYLVPANTTGRIKLQTLFDFNSFSNGSFNITVGVPNSDSPRSYVVQGRDLLYGGVAVLNPVNTIETYLSSKYSVSISSIQQANPSLNNSNIAVGTSIVIPQVTNTSSSPAIPSVLTNSSINSSCGGLKLTWPSVLSAASYKVYRSSTSAGSYVLVSGTTATSYSVLGNGSSYYYKISAVNSNGESGQSGFILGTETGQCANPVSDKVFTNKPTPKVSATCGGPVSLSWKTVPGASTYNVFRSTTSNGKFTQISGSAGTSYTDNPGVGSFYYKILATGTGGSSQSSISVNVKQCKADIPTTPTVTTGTCGGQINISWTPVANANTYNIFRSKTATGGYAQIAKGITASTTTYVDVSSAKNNLMVTTSQTTTVNKKKVTTKVTNPGTFFYKISATNSVGTTVQSPAASATASGVCSVSENPIQVKGFLAVVWEAVSSWFK